MMIDDGLVDGRTQNLSLKGAFIRCSELPKVNTDFRLVITTKDRLIPVAAELVWSDANHTQDKSAIRGIGVRFTNITNDDRSFLRGAISQHI
jgi:Tfp pilus assembly protein PilZ